MGAPDTEPAGCYLNDALPLVADTLESFTFESISASNMWSHIGGDGTLSCLPQLKSLKHAKLDIGILFREPARLEDIDLRHRLPESLEVLDIAELWPDVDLHNMDDKLRAKYEIDLQSMLHNLILESRKQLPNLKTLLYRSNPFYRPMKFAEQLFSGNAGVKFEVLY
jgi:hypothetical protein